MNGDLTFRRKVRSDIVHNFDPKAPSFKINMRDSGYKNKQIRMCIGCRNKERIEIA